MDFQENDEHKAYQHYRSLVENLSGGYFFYIKDRNGHFTSVSPSITKALGYTQDEFINYYHNFLTDHPGNREMEEFTKRSLQGILQPTHELEIFHKDGNFHWLELNEIPTFNDKGEIIGLEGIAHDISKRKNLEADLQRFRNLLDQTRDAIFIATPDTGRYLDANDAACSSLGYTREEILSMRVLDIEVLFETDADWKEHIRQLREKKTIVAEGKHRRKDGSVFDVEVNVQYISHREHDYIVAIIRDITERKQMEEKLLETKERYATLFEESKDPLYIVDIQGRFKNVNNAMIELFGFSRDEIIGMNVREVYADPKERGRFLHNLMTQGFLKDYELHLKKKDGTVIECLLSTIIRKRNNIPYEYQGIIRDVTERRRMRERIQDQERLASLGQLSSGIAHDFNNILMGITGYSQLMLRSKELPEKFRGHLEIMLKQGQRASQLIKKMLDFGRRTVIQKQTMDLGDFLEEEVKLLRSVIPENIAIDLVAPAGNGFVIQGDATQMHQVLLNLGVNSADAMPRGGTISIHLTALTVSKENQTDHQELSPGNWLYLSVADTGTIIPPHVMKHIFEPFFTTKEVGKGTGLGLSQVYGIVKQHEGHIEVESSKEIGGTMFNIYLPKVQAIPKEFLKEEDHSTPRGNGETVLLVEDEPVVLEAIEYLLDLIGYKVITANNGAKALEIYRKNPETINVVVTDVVMPVMGGVELYRTLRKEAPELKVIMISGYPLGDENRELLSEGVVEWIQKPLPLEALAQALRKALDNV